jgi:hypothetical protein
LVRASPGQKILFRFVKAILLPSTVTLASSVPVGIGNPADFLAPGLDGRRARLDGTLLLVRNESPEAAVKDTEMRFDDGAILATFLRKPIPGTPEIAAWQGCRNYRLDFSPELLVSSGDMELSGQAEEVRGVARFSRKRVFVLSPANASGKRAQLVLRERAEFALAVRLRERGLPIGEIFSFISGLYFRGKLAYARAFAEPPSQVPGVLVITSSRGLVRPETLLSLDELRTIGEVSIDVGEPRYRAPLTRDAMELASQLDATCEVILLGSIATPKYVEPLLETFGESLLFPADFVGRGDMSRGGLLLRSARQGVELAYASVARSVRRGSRPPKLPKLPKEAARRMRDRDYTGGVP